MRFGPYEVLDELGRGGMGRVFRARHLPTGVVRALKTLDGSPDLETLERFRREGETLARAGGAGVVSIHEAGLEGRTVWFAMELMPGGSLRARLKAEERVPWREAVAIVHEVATALGRLHALGLVHRDLKPDNILFDEEGRARLADFGCVRDLTATRLTQTGTVVGTPTYMAPEQLDGRPADARSDVYGLGVVLYELVTGRRPYAQRGIRDLLEATLRGAYPRPGELVPVPAALDALIAATLAPDPGRRPAEARALAAALERLLEGGDGSTTAVSKERSRLPLVLAVAVGLSLAFAGSAALVLATRGPGGSAARPPGRGEVPGVPAVTPVPPSPDTATATVESARACAERFVAHFEEMGRNELVGVKVGVPRALATELARACTPLDDAQLAAVLAPLTSMARAWTFDRHGPPPRSPGISAAWPPLAEAVSLLARRPLLLEAIVLSFDVPHLDATCGKPLHDWADRRDAMARRVADRDPLVAALLVRDAWLHSSSFGVCPRGHGRTGIAAIESALASAEPARRAEADRESAANLKVELLVSITLLEAREHMNDAVLRHSREGLLRTLEGDPVDEGRATYFASQIVQAAIALGTTALDPELAAAFARRDVAFEAQCLRAHLARSAGDEAAVKAALAEAERLLPTRAGLNQKRSERILQQVGGKVPPPR